MFNEILDDQTPGKGVEEDVDKQLRETQERFPQLQARLTKDIALKGQEAREASRGAEHIL